MRLKVLVAWLMAALMLAIASQGCKKDDTGGINVPSSGAHDNLSDYGFFQQPMSELVPVTDRIMPYDLNTTLFTDYSLKQRFIYIPEGKQADYDSMEVFNFPDGTVLIKNFYYRDDFRDEALPKNILETRLLIKRSGTWEAETYIWNDEQTEATRFIAGKVLPVSWIDLQGNAQTVNYLVPNKNECKGCHDYNNDIIPIGPKARHLNRDYDFTGGTENQLDKLVSLGMLNGMPGATIAPKLPVWDAPATGSLELRARAYLDINCGNCHNPAGPANNSGLHLEYHVTDPEEWGVCKAPVAAGNGSGGRLYDIVPGDPDASILVYRMEVNDPDIRMPELGRSLEHTEAVDIIRQWIAQMPGDCN